MAKVQQVILCPKCRMEIKKDADHCTYCGFRWQVSVEQGYKKPEYIYLQELSVKEDRSVWFKNCPHEAQIAALEDAYRTLQYVLYSTPVQQQHMKKLTAIGKSIGRLATAIESYATEGGHIEYAGTTKPTDEEDTQ